MKFFDEIVSTTKSVTATAGKKTDEAVKISKLKVKKAQLNSEIKSKLEKLGASVYQAAKAGEKNADYEAAINAIDACYESVAELDRQLDEITGKIVCSKCGAKTKSENNYCPKCGSKLPVVEAVEESDTEKADAE